VINISNGTFYRKYPSTTEAPGSNPSIFPDLNFSLPNTAGTKVSPQYWSVISPSSLSRTTFLQVLAGQLICIPPTARSYPYLSELSESPQHAIKYVGFDAERGNSVGGTNVRGAYLSARYESRREETDFSLYDYLTGHTELNALERDLTVDEIEILEEVSEQLNLRKLMSMPVANLSNGQTRRARIAKALVARPELLLLDGPFMGLDPRTLATMSQVLMQLAARQRPRLIMSLRPEDGVPAWVSHLIVIGEKLEVLAQGEKVAVLNQRLDGGDGIVMRRILDATQHGRDATNAETLSRDAFPKVSPPYSPGEPLVEMSGVKVAYGDKVVLGDWQQPVSGEDRKGLWWDLRRGQRCGIFGPNGSGKTTMLSLITSDHPQTYSLPIKLFGRSRLPSLGEAGISVFDIQQRMGHSSPEVHAFFPKSLTIRRAISSAWADAPMAKPRLTEDARRRIDACLRWFAKELHPSQSSAANESTGNNEDLVWADDTRFAELSFSNQRLILFLRAIVANPDLVILDEALSGIDEATRDKALLFLSHGEKVSGVIDAQAQQSTVDKARQTVFDGLSSDQALLVISHSREDVPGCLREWICLPEPTEGRPPRTGVLPGPLELNPQCWDEIWSN
jgi:ABC-type molybdenum transport system ATPase subunit/photorepair protein PhrA